MANIKMNRSSFGNYSFQRNKVSSMSNSTVLNGVGKDFPQRSQVKFIQESSFKPYDRDQLNKCKLPFSEKLKHLLENGSSVENIDQEDPYAFQDVELSTLTNSINGSNDNISPDEFSPKPLSDFVASNNKIDLTEVSRPTDNAFDSHISEEPSSPELPESPYPLSDILPRHPAEAAKVQSPLLKGNSPSKARAKAKKYQMHIDRTGTSMKIVFSPQNGRPLAGGGKPLNFGKSQMSKLAIAKIEKSMEGKSRSVSRGKPLHSPQKTASLSRLLSRAKRPTPIRSASLDSDSPLSRSKTGARKSLLEESLLGMKSNEWTNRVNRSANPREAPSIVQTGTTTVQVPSRPRHRAINQGILQKTWTVRNKIKLLKRNYLSFGLLIDDTQHEEAELCHGRMFQNYWFSLSNDYNTFSGHNRNAKLAQLKTELRHKLQQQQWRYRNEYQDEMAKLLIKAARHQPNLTALLVQLENSNRHKNKVERWRGQFMEELEDCGYQESGQLVCRHPAIPSIGFCEIHITQNQNQLLFTSCSAVSSDHQPCPKSAIGRHSEKAYCAFHLRLQVNSQKPKKLAAERTDIRIGIQGKKSKSSLSSSRNGRSRKRKRHATKERKESPVETIISANKDCETTVINDINNRVNILEANTLVVSKSDIDESQDVEVGEDLPLDSAELASLANQATRLLEDNDLTNVLNHIPPDAFNDLFTEDKEEYAPTPQETEELERALEAVTNDVQSLEKQTQSILDMLDEQTIAQTLAEVVPVLYQNGFNGLGPLEQTLCSLHPDPINTLPIPPQTDVLQS